METANLTVRMIKAELKEFIKNCKLNESDASKEVRKFIKQYNKKEE